MAIMQTQLHKGKQVNGHVEGKPFSVHFDSEGYSTEDVEDAVAQRLIKTKTATIASDVVPDDTTDLSKLNPQQLKSYAKKNGIDCGSATKKADLLEIISKAQAKSSDAGGGGGTTV